MEEQKLIIKFSNGEVYEVPASSIAEARTDYYMKVDGYERLSEDWKKEFQYVMNNENELLDWVQNNMDWSDLKGAARKVEPKDSFDYDEEFFNAKFLLKF